MNRSDSDSGVGDVLEAGALDSHRKGAMKLSEAIQLGAMMSPQAFRALFRDDGTCALGAALLAVGPVSEPALRSVCKWWPWAVTVSVDCPGCGRSCPVFGVITHLNDTHRWTREQIAGWVASVEPAEAWPPEEAAEAAWQALSARW